MSLCRPQLGESRPFHVLRISGLVGLRPSESLGAIHPLITVFRMVLPNRAVGAHGRAPLH
jgi:hypothetical protein